MNPTRPSSLLLLALISACAADADSEAFSGLDDVRASAQLQEVCDPTHQVAYRSSPFPCDDSNGWVGERLFPGASQALGGYCRYTYSPGGATGSEVADLAANLPPSTSLHSDCRAVAPQGDAISAEVHQDLYDYFGWSTGRVSAAELQAATAGLSLTKVVVAVVDTYPDDEPEEPNSDHGPIMMSFIEDIACPGDTCSISVQSKLGLPRTASGVDTKRGGVVGLQSDLARAIHEAVEENLGEHLIINLSVGWESEMFGGTGPGNMPPPVRAVYDAVRYARCNGALIIAAAGNSTGLTDVEVPLAPARWEGMSVPTASQCSSSFGMAPSEIHVDNAAYAPLVHAIGGLYGSGSEMVMSREFGMPRLAAAASHAVAYPRAGFTEHQVRTGTSVSTAVASAAASLVWSINPTLTPSKVMARLYSGGEPTGLVSDFGGPAKPVRRIEVCKTLNTMLAGAPLSCGGAAPQTGDIVAALLPLGTSHSLVLESPTSCGDVKFYQAEGEGRTCPDLERDPWAWLTSPQPPKPGCADCVLTTTTQPKPTAIITLDDEYADDTLISADVIVTEEDGKVHRFSLGERDIVTGEVVLNLTTGEIDHYELPIDFGGTKPATSELTMKFMSGVETEDSMIVD